MPKDELIALVRRRVAGQAVKPKKAGFFSFAGAR
jgi:hypothetical protein